MELDGNIHALNSRMDEQETAEIALENFQYEVKDDLEEIGRMIEVLKSVSKDYDGYDFSDDLADMIGDL